MILLIDHYDSFVHTLARYVQELGGEPVVRREGALTVDEVGGMAPSHIILSPGPCTPAEAGISPEVVRRWGSSIPILGVCLGHQIIGAAYGGRIVRAPPVHGKVSAIHHAGTGLFTGLPNPFPATRYHSLVIERTSLPADLEVTAETADHAIMAVRHRAHPVAGVQFHPESVLTRHGYALLDRFLRGDETPPRELPAEADRPGLRPIPS